MRGKSAEKTERLRTKALDGLREKRTCSEVCKVKNRIGKLKTVNGGLALQTSLGKNGVIVTYQQISCHLKIEAKMSIHYKTMAHLLKDSWSWGSFLESPENFSGPKSHLYNSTCLFCKAGLFICCKGNKN